ncbi:MAG TPA: methyltransferase [Ktedonobacterales bacterium]
MSQLPPPLQIVDYVCGAMKTQALHACANLGIPDLLKDGPQSTVQLAAATGADPTNLYRLLRVLVAMEILDERAPGVFQATALSHFLQSEQSLYHLAMMAGVGWVWKVQEGTQGTGYSLRSGQSAFGHLFGMDVWSYLNERPQDAAHFHRAMSSTAAEVADEPIAQALSEHYELAEGTFVDVGGGIGNLLIAVLRRNPGLRGVLLERPAVIELARERIAQAGLAARCELVAGDFFEAVPSGGDYYFMRQIIKDWADEQDVRILRNCLRAMNSRGRILVAEQILAPGRADLLAKLTDFLLMVTLPGRERDEYEFEQLFSRVGLRVQHILPTTSAYKVLEVS